MLLDRDRLTELITEYFDTTHGVSDRSAEEATEIVRFIRKAESASGDASSVATQLAAFDAFRDSITKIFTDQRLLVASHALHAAAREGQLVSAAKENARLRHELRELVECWRGEVVDTQVAAHRITEILDGPR